MLTKNTVTELANNIHISNGVNKPRFNAIVGNPPYQKEAERENFSTAIYHEYMIIAQRMGTYVSLVYPSRWMLGGTGNGLNDFRTNEGRSKHYRRFYDHSNAKTVFDNVGILGGVCYFLWDKNKNTGLLKYYYNNIYNERETIDENGFVRDNDFVTILEKIKPVKNMSELVHSRTYYGNEFTNIVKVNTMFKENTGIYCYAVGKGRVLTKIEVEYPNSKNRSIDDYKVAVSNTANDIKGSDKLRRNGRIFIAEPNSIISDSFLKIGSFEKKQEAVNCLRYLKTDLCNFLLAIITPTQHVTKSNYKLLPLVNFATGEIMDKPGVFLNFDKPESLDEQLYSIYNITSKEQNIITDNVRPWNDKVSITADE